MPQPILMPYLTQARAPLTQMTALSLTAPLQMQVQLQPQQRAAALLRTAVAPAAITTVPTPAASTATPTNLTDITALNFPFCVLLLIFSDGKWCALR